MAINHDYDVESLLALYDDSFYRQAVLWQGPAAFNVARALQESYQPKSVIDVGCGPGTYLTQLRLLDIAIHGLEGSEAALKQCLRQDIPVEHVDLTKPYHTDRTYDLTLCFEVAEHLPVFASTTLVNTIVGCGKQVVFTAAPPGQGGTGHVNEQPLVYWDNLFGQFGYVNEPERVEWLHEQFNRDPDINPWLLQNLRCYQQVTDSK